MAQTLGFFCHNKHAQLVYDNCLKYEDIAVHLEDESSSEHSSKSKKETSPEILCFNFIGGPHPLFFFGGGCKNIIKAKLLPV